MRFRLRWAALSVLFSVVVLDGHGQGVQPTTLALGSGPRQIGLVMRPNEECRGPATIAPAAGGRLAILDKVNRKIVVIGGAQPEDVPLPRDLVEPSDLIVGTRGYAVVGALGDLVLVDAKGNLLQRAKVDHNPEQGAVRLVVLDNVFGIEDLRGKRTSIGAKASQIGELVVYGVATAATYTRLESSPSLVVLGNSAVAGPLASITLKSRANMRIVEVRPVWVEQGAGALIAVQERGGSPDESNYVRLVAVDAKGSPTAEAFLGPESFACDIRRPFARLTDGRVVSLAFRGKNGLALEILSFRPLGSSPPKAVSQGAEAVTLIAEDAGDLQKLESLNGTSTATTISLSPTTPKRILDRARASLELRWKLTATNFSHPDVPNECDPPKRIWRRPGRLDALLDKEVKSVPYRWGGYVSTLDGFKAHLSEGRLAGDVCTCRIGNCVFKEATGQDCSGFVSYAWDTGSYYTTVSLPKEHVSVPLKWEELALGDIVNKAGSHVRLVEMIESESTDRIITVIESAANESCGGVCRRPYRESELRRGGYKPLRRVALAAD
jgi:hypothetical protein